MAESISLISIAVNFLMYVIWTGYCLPLPNNLLERRHTFEGIPSPYCHLVCFVRRRFTDVSKLPTLFQFTPSEFEQPSQYVIPLVISFVISRNTFLQVLLPTKGLQIPSSNLRPQWSVSCWKSVCSDLTRVQGQKWWPIWEEILWHNAGYLCLRRDIGWAWRICGMISSYPRCEPKTSRIRSSCANQYTRPYAGL